VGLFVVVYGLGYFVVEVVFGFVGYCYVLFAGLFALVLYVLC